MNGPMLLYCANAEKFLQDPVELTAVFARLPSGDPNNDIVVQAGSTRNYIFQVHPMKARKGTTPATWQSTPEAHSLAEAPQVL